VPGQRRNTRAVGSPKGPRADTYIYIYIDFAKPKAAPSGTITSAKLQSRVCPKSTGISAIQNGHRLSCGEPSGPKVPVNLIARRLSRQRGPGTAKRNPGAMEQGLRRAANVCG